MFSWLRGLWVQGIWVSFQGPPRFSRLFRGLRGAAPGRFPEAP